MTSKTGSAPISTNLKIWNMLQRLPFGNRIFSQAVPDFYQASAHVGCGCLRGFRRGRVVAVQQRSGCACRLG